MSKNLQKSVHEVISKMKKPSQKINLANSISFSKKFIAGCRHPRTLSFAFESTHTKATKDSGGESHNHNHNHKDEAATLSDIDKFLQENFRSLYVTDDDNGEKKGTELGEIENDDEVFQSPSYDGLPPGPHPTPRFHAARPGFTRSFMEEIGGGGYGGDGSVTTSVTTNATSFDDIGSSSDSSIGRMVSLSEKEAMMTAVAPEECIAVLKSSSDPYEEFRRSMEEMVEARLKDQVSPEKTVDWEFMEALLFSYFNLNDRKWYKFILSAFVDLVAVLNEDDVVGCEKEREKESSHSHSSMSVRTVGRRTKYY